MNQYNLSDLRDKVNKVAESGFAALNILSDYRLVREIYEIEKEMERLIKLHIT